MESKWCIIMAALFCCLGVRAGDFGEKTKRLFVQGEALTGGDAEKEWKCFYEEGGKIHLGSDYELTHGSEGFVVGNMMPGDKKIEYKNGALLLTNKANGSTTFVAYRRVGTTSGTRMVIEESSNLDQWQMEGNKSAVSGFTPYLYLICAEGSEVERFLVGNEN